MTSKSRAKVKIQYKEYHHFYSYEVDELQKLRMRASNLD